jgi:hypothetical protein
MWGFFVNVIFLYIFVKINNKDMHEFKFFQPKHLFITFDGYKIYPDEDFISVNKYEIKRRGESLPALTIVKRWPISKKFANKFKEDDSLVYFKHLHYAKRYVSRCKNNYFKSKI